MKKILSLLALAALTIGLLGSCSKINGRIDGIDKRVYDLENSRIASIEQQITAINQSITDLKAADETIGGKIGELTKTAEALQTLIDALKEADKALEQKDDALEARIATLEGQVAVINGQIKALEDADKAINSKIDELKTYVDTELGKTKDWATETFATLTQYQQTADDLAALSVTVTGISTTLAGVQTSIANLDTKIDGIDTALQDKIAEAKTELEGKISDLKTELEGKIDQAISISEASVKAWINELLEGYYTAAEVDAKISALNTIIEAANDNANEGIDSLATELTTLKTAVDTAKANIRTEYKNAISTAINKLDGEIRGALKDSILAVNGRIEALDTRVTALEGRIQAVEGKVDEILAMIQSVSITPAYSDGSVEAVNGILTLKCIVKPAEALSGIESLKDSLLIYADSVKVKTKGASAYMEIKVSEATVTDAKQGAISLKADISEYLPKGADKALTVALSLRNGLSDFTTEFVPIYVNVIPLPEGALAGKFSVSTTKKVLFSKGNLVATIDATGAPTAWKFATNQYDYIGNATANTSIGKTAGDVDLFGWSTASTTYGISTSISTSKYSGDFVDWGKAYCEKNNITPDNTWRTLSKDEWTYLFNTRTASTVSGTENARYAKATVNDIKGIILLPDTYAHPEGVSALTSINTADAAFTVNTYDLTNWTKLESAGAVFLPAAGRRFGSNVDYVGGAGYYWSSTASDSDGAFSVYFNSLGVYPDDVGSRLSGCSVRLITECTTSGETHVESVSLDKTSAELLVGGTVTLTATVLPADATDKNVSWSSDKADVATVDASGKVTAVAPGDATITVTTVDGGKTATCAVKVVKAALPANALPGEFSVSTTKKVLFSKGNLVATIDATGAPTAWKFAANQYDYLGEGGANKTIGQAAGDVDLFGWSTVSMTYGISTSASPGSYLGAFVDWGKAYCEKNNITPDNTWRTLSKDEWTYLFNTRTASTVSGTENARYAKATVNSKAGIILLPDTYAHPEGVSALTSINTADAAFAVNTYDLTNWTKLESAGAVFLPAAGYRYGSDVYDVGGGLYWSSTSAASVSYYDAYYAIFNSFDVSPDFHGARLYGFSVRLITESK